jgi:hypothetical protein
MWAKIGITVFSLFNLKAGPPHIAGGVFFLGGSYGYIKGGEMERLINFCIIGFFIFFFRWIFFLYFTAGVIFIIGDVPAFTFELERTQGNYFFGFALAINAFGKGWGRDALQGFKSFPAFQTSVFVNRHFHNLHKFFYNIFNAGCQQKFIFCGYTWLFWGKIFVKN